MNTISDVKRAQQNATLCAADLCQLTQKVIMATLRLHDPDGLPFGGLASGARRIAARLEVIGTDNTPDMREWAKGELNWTDEQKNGLAAAIEIIGNYSSDPEIFIQIKKLRYLFFPETKSKTIGE